MKLPRWLLIGLWTSSVLAPLAAAGWWWVTWPERTARDYVDLMAQGRFEEARQMVELQCDHGSYSMQYTLICSFWAEKKWSWLNSEPKPRTLVDVFCARQWYTIAAEPHGWEFQVAGRKIYHPSPHGFSPLHLPESEVRTFP